MRKAGREEHDNTPCWSETLEKENRKKKEKWWIVGLPVKYEDIGQCENNDKEDKDITKKGTQEQLP